ncbi:MAG: hypothetical protein ORN57_04480, partial [Alphaproteobacteria bacterium]|nr:hypothetical protein [Alphaproteobacteria bacterium]
MSKTPLTAKSDRSKADEKDSLGERNAKTIEISFAVNHAVDDDAAEKLGKKKLSDKKIKRALA